jgi:hypothetical protein
MRRGTGVCCIPENKKSTSVIPEMLFPVLKNKPATAGATYHAMVNQTSDDTSFLIMNKG